MAAARPLAGGRALTAAAAAPLPLPLPSAAAAVSIASSPLPCRLHNPLRPSSRSGRAAAAFATGKAGRGGDAGKRRSSSGREQQQDRGRRASAAASPPPPPPPNAAPAAPAAPPPEVGWMWSGGGSGGRASATKQSLKSAGLRAKKSLGQNFLTDEATLARIVRASGVHPGDLVLEVGPGTGNLTRHLVSAGAKVTAVEKDDALAGRLRDAVPGLGALVHGDVLRVGLGSVVARMLEEEEGEEGQGSRSVKIVANLPYNITKEFLLAALPLGGELERRAAAANDGGDDGSATTTTTVGGVSEVTLMLEEDAARRLADPKPGRPDYRAMSVLVHRWSRPQYLFRIPKDRYYPQPGVDGAMVRFRLVAPRDRPALPFSEPGPEAERAHAALVNAAFSERRKMMRNVLTSGLGRGGRAWGAPTRDPAVVAAALQDAGARDEARPQELSPVQFAAFHCALVKRAADARGGVAVDPEDEEDQGGAGVARS